MGWFWNDNINSNNNNDNNSSQPQNGDDSSLCPYLSDDKNNSRNLNGKDAVNPFNNMPNLANTPTADQKLHLTKDRTISNIPMGTAPQKKWEYPSAQQMYIAMLRKGKLSKVDNLENDTIESMVQIHNFLNESCWLEILRWEKKYTDLTGQSPKLLKFMGKPGVLTPRARFHYYMSYMLPWFYERELPFDRHDWIVLRPKTNLQSTNLQSTNKESDTTDSSENFEQIRYVLDFYTGPDDANGMPTFSVDVRPALDNLTNVKDRIDHLLNH